MRGDDKKDFATEIQSNKDQSLITGERTQIAELPNVTVQKKKHVHYSISDKDQLAALKKLSPGEITSLRIYSSLFNANLKDLSDLISRETRIAELEIEYRGNHSRRDLKASISSQDTEEAMKAIASWLRKLQLEKLTLRLRSYQEGVIFSMKNIKMLAEGIGSLSQHLRELKLDFLWCHTISDRELEVLMKEISKLFSLQYLTFVLNSCAITDNGLTSLKTGLKTCLALRSVSLDLSKNDIILKDKSLWKEYFSNCRYLEKLIIKFEACFTLVDGSIISISNGIKNLLSLKSLEINLTKCTNITSQGIANLIPAFIRLRDLSSFKLCLDECEKISNSGLKYLKKGIKELYYLHNLEFRCLRCENISVYGLALLWKGIRQARVLQCLKLAASILEQISEKCFEVLKAEAKQLKSLQELNLDYGRSKTVKDDTLMHFIEILKFLPSLMCLNFNLTGCQGVYSQGFMYLSEGIQRLQLLRSLSLDFSYIEQVTDLVLLYLSEGITPLIHLKKLELDFSCLKYITDKGLYNLRESFKGLECLEHMFLSFYDNDNITKTGMGFLADGLKELSNLKFLKCDTGRCQWITNIELIEVKAKLAHIPELDFCQFC